MLLKFLNQEFNSEIKPFWPVTSSFVLTILICFFIAPPLAGAALLLGFPGYYGALMFFKDAKKRRVKIYKILFQAFLLGLFCPLFIGAVIFIAESITSLAMHDHSFFTKAAVDLVIAMISFSLLTGICALIGITLVLLSFLVFDKVHGPRHR
ncbi:MAG: hypothetical protein JWM96_627 [Alphaproteobacteria bacterium]|nr:hypothetical protein [Alphaproteobacteria bacterium]